MYAEPETVELADAIAEVALPAAITTARNTAWWSQPRTRSVIGRPPRNPAFDRLQQLFVQRGEVERHLGGSVGVAREGAQLDQQVAVGRVAGLHPHQPGLLARGRVDQ